MIQLLKVSFFMQERTKVRRHDAKQESHEQITAVPLIPNKVQTKASKLRQINPGQDEGLSVRKARQRKERS